MLVHGALGAVLAEHGEEQPGPGVYATDNSVATPALLPDGSPAEDSVNATLVARTPVRDAVGLTAVTKQAMAVPRQGDAPSVESTVNAGNGEIE